LPVCMDGAVLETTTTARRPEPPRPGNDVADLYAAAAARIIVTSKRRFVTSCGVRRFTGEVMAVDSVQPAEAAALEAAFVALIGGEPLPFDLNEVSTLRSTSPLFDPDVLLAWLLTEGVSMFH